MRTTPALLAGLLALAFAASAAEDSCTPTTSQPEVDTGPTPFGHHYIDNDLCQVDDGSGGGYDVGGFGVGGCLFSTWIYVESNDIPGLQRGDEMHDDTCGGQIQSDSITPY